MSNNELGVRPYVSDDAAHWDDLVAGSVNGTFMHTRRFLSYHGDRFADRSLVIIGKKGQVRGVLPAATVPDHSTIVRSHPGLSYGGLVHDGSIRGQAMLAVMQAIAAHYRAEGFETFQYKAIPGIYERALASDDLYALHRLGAVRYRCDLSATVDLAARGEVSHGRRTGLARAARLGVQVNEEWGGAVDQFWEILATNLKRHDATPTHSIEEIEVLRRSFPENIRLLIARLDGEVVAGTVIFDAGVVSHTQYIASSDAGRAAAALDPVIEGAIRRADGLGFRYFDFGISTEDEGRCLNDGLQTFKLSFGAGAVVFEHFQIDLTG